MIRDNKGFSLAHILIALTVIGILCMIGIPLFYSQSEESKQEEDLTNMRNARAEAAIEYSYTGYPGPYYYDVSTKTVSLEKPKKGYGRSTTPVNKFVNVMDGAYGTPNENGNANYITVTVTGAGIELRWGGNDLSTDSGRRKEDIDSMHRIANALNTAYHNHKLSFNKDYIEVAVYADGTMHYFNNSNGGIPWSEESTKTIINALDVAGLSTRNTPIYATDSAWKDGYIVHIENDGTLKYKKMLPFQNLDEHIGWGWWNNSDLSEEELKVS